MPATPALTVILSCCVLLYYVSVYHTTQVLQPIVQQLFALQPFMLADDVPQPSSGVSHYFFSHVLPSAPDSWRQGRRMVQPFMPVTVTLQVPVSQVKEKCMQAATSSTRLTGACQPFCCVNGSVFDVRVVYSPTAQGGSTVGLWVSPRQLTKHMICKISCDVQAGSGTTTRLRGLTVRGGSYMSIDLPGMQFVKGGGWDSVCWANAGLPTSGNLEVKVTFYRDQQSAPRVDS